MPLFVRQRHSAVYGKRLAFIGSTPLLIRWRRWVRPSVGQSGKRAERLAPARTPPGVCAAADACALQALWEILRRPRGAGPKIRSVWRAPHGCASRPARKAVTWLILPVVICLSQRLSHACLSINCLYCETANGSLNQL